MLEITNLSKSYGNVQAIKSLSFTVEEHEVVCIVGPSGCGKTTLLKCLSGLMKPTSGHASLGGRAIDGPPETLALVFQDYMRSLLPWMTVEENVALPLRAQGVGKRERLNKADDCLKAVGLPNSGNMYPWQLSGGMQQRVAIARALAYRPKVLLMDEPFASVDAQTRGELEDLVLHVRDKFDVTVVVVTHDIDEAVYLSDRVVVLSDGPTTVQEIVPIELKSERDQVTTKELPEFAHLRGHIARLIKGTSAGASPVQVLS